MKNTGIKYEILVQAIFQEILRQEMASNIAVQHDVVLSGKSGITHQIDVYWSFLIAGVKYETVIQVKDWNQSVKQEQILTFKSVLDDLPGQPRGIIVTKSRLQKGAKQFANANGIVLFELKEEPKPPPITIILSGMTIVHMEAKPEEDYQKSTLYDVSFRELSYLGDIEWLKQQNEKFGTEIVDKAMEWTGEINPHEEYFFDEQKSIVTNLQSIKDELLEEIKEEYIERLERGKLYAKKVSKIFLTPTYCGNPSAILPFSKINGVSMTIEIKKQGEFKSPWQPIGFTRFVLTNIQDGQEKHFFIKDNHLPQSSE
jgi:Restriction endonuclease